MKKEDFRKGQTVWVYLTGDAARGMKTTEERIQEWEVVSVGRKYITARPKGTDGWRDTKFEIENGFRKVYTYGTADYLLFLSKEDILNKIWRSETQNHIENFASWERGLVRKMSDEDLRVVADILRKYDKEDTKG